jgi:site-specific recombinase XerD
MKLHDLVTRYVAHRRALGEACTAAANILSSFCRALGPGTDLRAVRRTAINAFLTVSGRVTRTWQQRYTALRGLYRYAASRGYVRSIPLPTAVPKLPPALVPYIYSRDELRRLLAAVEAQAPSCLVEKVPLRTIVLLLYGAGLRASEALALDCGDVNLAESLVTVRLSKFFKSRLVPVGVRLTRVLAEYAAWRRANHPSAEGAGPFFISRTGRRIPYDALHRAFHRLRSLAGVRRSDGGRYQPRLHDLRHTFAVHRLTTWYEQGADVQVLLPQLSVYLGHTYLAATQVYLTMTPELLRAAGHRFERYAGRGCADE